MDHDRMKEILETLRPNEVEDVLNFVKINERDGLMSCEEAEEWRKQIRVRQGILRLDE